MSARTCAGTVTNAAIVACAVNTAAHGCDVENDIQTTDDVEHAEGGYWVTMRVWVYEDELDAGDRCTIACALDDGHDGPCVSLPARSGEVR